ncbi:MAG TPA: VWA domain-containing protein [Vicinamibacterales bacterium]|nr:VWA domain-containing protein [Vicinamibacterales bacterium]
MVRFGVALSAAAIASVVLTLSAQQAPPPQTPPPQTPQQQAEPPAQQPIFRVGADVIRLDVSVLDKDRRPIHGLTAEDFTVNEEGKPQRVVAVAEIDAAANDPAPTAWMRHVSSDVANNDLADQIGDGRLFAIVLDDVNVPWDDLDIIMAARGIARDVIDRLGPSDTGAVVFPRDGGRTEDFTSDKEKLINAVDRFDPHEPEWTPPGSNTYVYPGPVSRSGDQQRSSTLFNRSNCERQQLTVPMFETVVSRLATVPNRRKTIVFISTGPPIDFGAQRGCPGEQKDRMLEVFARASRANINIYSIDPGGYGGYERYLQDPIRRAGRPAPATFSDPTARSLAKLRRDFLEVMAGYTGATAIVNSDEIDTGINHIFTEASSYYLLGYQTSNGRPDGKYRKVDVKVKRPGSTVRTRSGYFAPKDAGTARDSKDTPAVNDLGLVGLMDSPALALRATAVPVALAAHGRDADVAVVLSVRVPSPRSPVPEAVTVVRNLYDGEGRAGPPVLEKSELTLLPSTGDELRYDLYWKLQLAPGRYQLRLNATSKATDKSGTVYADIEVPDYTRAPLSLSAMVVGGKGAPVPRTDALKDVLPIIPTAARDFAPGDNIAGFVRVFQGGDGPLGPVNMTVQVLDVNDRKLLDKAETLTAEAFSAGRVAGYQFDLPLGQLEHGPHLVSVTATPAGGPPVRRDLVFRVR